MALRSGSELRRSRLVVALAAGLLGLALLSLSIPRLAAALHALPGDAIKGEYLEFVFGDAALPSDSEFAAWRASRNAALTLVASGDAYGDLALIDLVMAASARGDERRDHLLAARDQLRRALWLSPSNGFFWLRLAATERRLGAPADTILQAVRSSIVTAPYEPAALLPRVALLFRYWEEAGDDLRRQTMGQIGHLVAAADWKAFERLARQHPERLEELRGAVGDNDQALDAIEQGRQSREADM